MSNFDYVHLKQKVISATEQAFAHLKTVTKGESLYAFRLYTSNEGTYICPTANTEEGLLQKYNEYIQRGYHDTGRNDFRWNPCDWIYHLEGIEFFNDVKKIMLEGCSEDYSVHYFDSQLIFQTCIEALVELDRQFIFGKGESRESLVINLFKGDQSSEELIEYGKLLNPGNVSDRFEKEIIEISQEFYERAMRLAEEDEDEMIGEEDFEDF